MFSAAQEIGTHERHYTGIATWVGTPTWLPPIHRQQLTKIRPRDYFMAAPVSIAPLEEVIKSRYLRVPKRRADTRPCEPEDFS